MARGLSHEFKRVIAGACALMVVTGSVPMQPVADAFNSLAMAASADPSEVANWDAYAPADSDDLYTLVGKSRSLEDAINRALMQAESDGNEGLANSYEGIRDDLIVDTDEAGDIANDDPPRAKEMLRNAINGAITKLKALDISNLYAEATSATYNENALTPTLTWYKNVGTTDAEIVNLTAGTDYEITAVYKTKEDGSEYVPDGDSIGTSATEAGTYLVDIQGKGNYSGDQRIVWTISKADIAALTGVTTTYDGQPQNLVSGTPTAGTVFSLTAPGVDYDAEMQRVSALAERAYQAHENAPINGVERDYYLDAWSALSYYKNAISHLKNNEDSMASYCLDDTHAVSYADKVAASTFTPSADMQDVIDYIKTYIKGTDFDKTKARFTAADPVWKSADEITATDAGTYTVWYKYGGNSANYNDKVNSFTATINQAAPNVTGPTLINEDKTLNYTGKAQKLFVEGSVDEKMGTMEYAAATSKIDTNERELTLDDIKVGTIFKPTTETGFKFPENTRVNIIDFGTIDNNFSFNYNVSTRRIYLYKGTNTYGAVATYDAFIVDSIQDNGTINLKGFNTNNLNMNSLDWSTEVPERTDVGKYDVYYRVVSNEKSGNYSEVSPTKFGTVEIKYRTVTATLLNLDSDDAQKPKAKIVELDGTEEKELTPDNNGNYTLTATKTYRIYTQKTIAGATVEEYFLGSQPLGNGSDYKYCYTFNIPAAAEYDSAAFSHENNWKGAVYTDESDKLYIADGEVNKKTGTLAAILKGENTYYYGDTPTKNDVEIQDFAKGIVRVEEIYLENANGARVDDLNNVAYGEYKLKARVVIDADGDTDFETGSQTTQTMYKNVTYAPRPVEKCTTETSYIYYMENEKEHKLDVKTDEKTKEKYIEFPAYTYDGTEKTLPEMFIHTPDDEEKVLLVTNDPTAATKTDAGKYSFTAYPVDDTGAMALQKAKNYDGDILIRWQINKAEAKVTVAPKSDIVYDGKQLDINDFEITAVDGDNADALTKEFLATIGAKNSGTTAEVTPAKVETSNEADFTGADGIKINSNNCTEFVGKIINGNISFENAVYSAKIEKEESDNNLVISQSYLDSFSSLIKYQRSLRCLYINDGIIIASAAKGYMLQIDSITLSNSDEYTIKLKAVPAKKTTELTDSDLINASKTDEVKKANVVIKSKNFADIEYVQKFDEDDKDKIVEDKSLEVNIDKRQVTLTPAENSTTYGLEMPIADPAYTAETAADANGDGEYDTATGHIGEFKVPNVLTIEDFDYDTFANEAGDYEYSFDESKVDEANQRNYKFVVAEGAKFTVEPRKLTEDMFTLDDTSLTYNGKKQNAPKFTALDITPNDGDTPDDGYFAGVTEETTYTKAENADFLNDLPVYTTEEEKSAAYEAAKTWLVANYESLEYYHGGAVCFFGKNEKGSLLFASVTDVGRPSTNYGYVYYDNTEITSQINDGYKFYYPTTTYNATFKPAAAKSDLEALPVISEENQQTAYEVAKAWAEKNKANIKFTVENNNSMAKIFVCKIKDNDNNENEKYLYITVTKSDDVNNPYISDLQQAGSDVIDELDLDEETVYCLVNPIDKMDFNGDGDNEESFKVSGTTTAALPGTYSYEFTGTGNYTGTVTVDWTIDADTRYFAQADAYDFEYDGEDAEAVREHEVGIDTEGQPITAFVPSVSAGLFTTEDTVTFESAQKSEIKDKLASADFTEAQVKDWLDEHEDDFSDSYSEIAFVYAVNGDTVYYFKNGEGKTTDNIEQLGGSIFCAAKGEPRTVPASLKNANITYTYYKVDEFPSAINEDAVNDLEALEEAPKDAGSYIVKISTDARGYEIPDVYKKFTIRQRELAAIPNFSMTQEYGDPAPDLEDYEFEEDRVVEGDTVTKTGALKLVPKTDSDTELTMPYPVGEYELKADDATLSDPNYTLVISDPDYEVTPKEITDDDIEVTGVSIIGEDGKAVPGDKIKVTATLNNAEGEYEYVLFEGTDFEYLTDTKTTRTGGFSVQISGMGNFTGIAEATVDVANVQELASVEYTKVEIADIAKKQIRVAVKAEPEFEGYEIVKTGLVLWNSAEGEPSGELTLENAAQYDDIKTGGTAASEYSAKIKDNGAGIKAVGYVTLTDGTNTYTIYADEPVETTYDETAMESVSIDYTKFEIADMAKKQIRVAVASEVNTEGFEIVKTGLVLWNSAEGEPSGELTLENAEQYDDIKMGGKAASEYSAKIKDNGAGIKAVGYVTFSDGTNTYTKYCGEIVDTNFDQMNDRS